MLAAAVAISASDGMSDSQCNIKTRQKGAYYDSFTPFLPPPSHMRRPSASLPTWLYRNVDGLKIPGGY